MKTEENNFIVAEPTNRKQPSISGNHGREFQPGAQDCVFTAAER